MVRVRQVTLCLGVSLGRLEADAEGVGPAGEQHLASVVVEDGHAIHRPARGLFNKDVPHVAKVAASLPLDTPVTRGVAETAARWVEAWAKEAETTAKETAAE